MADLTTKAINTYGLNDETLGLGHKVLVVGDSAEYLTLVSDIAKKIVEDYAGSTLLKAAQSVQNAINTIPNAACMINSTYYTTIPNGSDLDAYVTTGVYGVSSNAAAKSLVNCPVEQSFKMIVEDRTTTASETGNYRYKWQRLYPLNTTDVYVRRLSTSDGGATWTIIPQEWEKQPTRTEMDGAYSLIEGPRPAVDIDWNTLTDAGVYFFNSAPTGSNKPIADSGKLIVERRLYNARDVRQTFYPATQSNGLIFVRTGSTNGTWGAWEKVPTRAEIDKISGIVAMADPGSMTSYSTQQFTVASSSRHLIIISGAKAVVHGLLLVSVNSSGGVFLTPIHVGDGLVITAPSNNVLQVENTSDVACYFTDICTNGTAITKVTESTNSAQNESI